MCCLSSWLSCLHSLALSFCPSHPIWIGFYRIDLFHFTNPKNGTHKRAKQYKCDYGRFIWCDFIHIFFFISNHPSKFAYELQTIKIIVWLPFDFDWRACVHLQSVREFIVIIWSTVFIWYSTKKNVQLYAVKGQQRWPCSLINMLCMSRRVLKKLSRFIR